MPTDAAALSGAVGVVRVDAWPRNSNGKIDHRRSRKLMETNQCRKTLATPCPTARH
jgi:hypothetical protein